MRYGRDILQRGHPESVIAPILFRCISRGSCSRLSLKMVTCSSLLRKFKLSLGFGAVMWVDMDLPILLFAHSFLHSSVLCCLIICGCGHRKGAVLLKNAFISYMLCKAKHMGIKTFSTTYC